MFEIGLPEASDLAGVDDAALVIQKQIVLRLKDFYTRNVVGRNSLTEFHRVRSLDLYLPHV